MHNALPLGGILASRGVRLDDRCALCGCDNETVGHMVFSCPFARLCWFISPLAVRSHALDGTLSERFTEISSATNDQQWTEVANIIWGLWRCRNETTYSSKKATPQRFLEIFAAISHETALGVPANRAIDSTLTDALELPGQTICNTDGSWLTGWDGGVGCVITNGSELVAYHSGKVQVCSPLQAEAEALRVALDMVQQRGIESCLFKTDCQVLASACMDCKPPTGVDWRAFAEVFYCWKTFKMKPEFKCVHVDRSHNELADYLAKQGRIEGWSYTGFTFPLFKS